MSELAERWQVIADLINISTGAMLTPADARARFIKVLGLEVDASDEDIITHLNQIGDALEAAQDALEAAQLESQPITLSA